MPPFKRNGSINTLIEKRQEEIGLFCSEGEYMLFNECERIKANMDTLSLKNMLE